MNRKLSITILVVPVLLLIMFNSSLTRSTEYVQTAPRTTKERLPKKEKIPAKRLEKPKRPGAIVWPDRPNKLDNLHKDHPLGKRPPNKIPGAYVPSGSFELTAARGIQPGLVWVTGTMSSNNQSTGVTTSVTCANFVSPDSVSISSQLIGNAVLRISIKTNLTWMENNNFARPCHINKLEVTMKGGPRHEELATAVVPVDIPMDVPFSHLRPTQVAFTAADTQVLLGNSQAPRRHVAYPPVIIAISSGGHIAFAEVEELPGRGPRGRSSLGLRYLITYNQAGNDVFELGGGAELYNNWGIDIERIGVFRFPTPTEESNPGHNFFSQSRVLPAHPLWNEQTYLRNVLDNKRVHRCWDGTNCLDIIYSATRHTIRANGTANIVSMDQGPIVFNGAVATINDDVATYYPPWEEELQGKLVREFQIRKFPQKKKTNKRFSRAKTKKIATRRALPKLDKKIEKQILATRFTPPRATHSSMIAEPLPQNRPDSPQTRDQSKVYKKKRSKSGRVALISGPTVPMSSINVSTLKNCTGNRAANFRCPTILDPIDVFEMPTNVQKQGELSMLDNLPPYYRGRLNATGNCGTHAYIQFYESMLNQVSNRLAQRRVINVDGTLFTVPEPPVAFSVAAGLSFLYTNYGTRVGGKWPDAGHMEHWPILDAYWPARSKDFRSWTNRKLPIADGGVALEYCTGMPCRLDDDCPSKCFNGTCAPACTGNNDCTATQTCDNGYCLSPCSANMTCPEGYICRGNTCWPKQRYWKEYCIGQGQPPIGVYNNYSRKRANLTDTNFDPLSNVPWSLANWPVNVWKNQTIEGGYQTWSEANQGVQFVINEIRRGLPVMLAFNSAVESIQDSANNTFSIYQGPTWFLPPKLGQVSSDELHHAVKPSKGHFVLIVGYSISGKTSDPDPFESYFVLENNWGKTGGHKSFYYMNLAAFALLTTELSTYRLDCDYPVAACQVAPNR